MNLVGSLPCCSIMMNTYLMPFTEVQVSQHTSQDAEHGDTYHSMLSRGDPWCQAVRSTQVFPAVPLEALYRPTKAFAMLVIREHSYGSKMATVRRISSQTILERQPKYDTPLKAR